MHSGMEQGGGVGSFRSPLSYWFCGVIPLWWTGQTDSFVRTAGSRRRMPEGNKFFMWQPSGGISMIGVDNSGQPVISGFVGQSEMDM